MICFALIIVSLYVETPLFGRLGYRSKLDEKASITLMILKQKLKSVINIWQVIIFNMFEM